MAELVSDLPAPETEVTPRRPLDEIEYRISAVFGYAWVGACIVGLAKLIF